MPGPPPVAADRRRRVARQARSGSRQQGFTFVGLLIIVLLMTSAMAIVGPVWEVASRRDKEIQLLFVGDEFRRAFAAYASFGSSDADRYPRELEDLVKDPRFAGNRRFLRRVYVDPMTNSTDWGLVRRPEGGGIIGVFSKSEKEPLKKANFRAAEKEFEGKTKYSEWVFAQRPPGIPQPQPGAQPQSATQPQPAAQPQPVPQAPLGMGRRGR